MNCPYCKSETRFAVKETRLIDGDVVRRRECCECGNHFGTRERIDYDMKLGRRENKKPVRKAPTVDRIDLGSVWK